MAEKNKPYEKFSSGLLTLTVWKNEQKDSKGKSFDTFSLNLSRAYKDKDGEWKHTDSFSTKDLPRIQHLVSKANAWWFEGKKDDDEKDVEEPIK